MTSNIDSWGKHFGYPECCIQSFKLIQLFHTLSKERQTASLHGFVPCQACAEKILNGTLDIQKVIQEKRLDPRPFKEYILPNVAYCE